MASPKDTVNEIEAALKSAAEISANLNKSLLQGGDGFESVVRSARALEDTSKAATRTITSLIGTLPGLGGVANTLDNLSDKIHDVVSVVDDLGSAYMASLEFVDSFSIAHRELDSQLFRVAASFGLTFDEAQAFTDYILNSAREISQADYGYINVQEFGQALQEAGRAKIPLDSMTDTIDTAAGSFNILGASILHAGSLGMETSTYFSFLHDAMRIQGQSAEEAMLNMADFGSVSSETGLTVDSIATSLNSLANRFAKVGLSADFGRPMLLAFSRTLVDMGIGIENALELSASLNESLAGLGTNYSSAFVTAQRGGLEMGGGSALGAGIQLQAKMLEAENDPTGQSQAKLAEDLAGAMRDTIASFTGGQIVTVQDAAQNSALESTFYTQSSLLQSMYNLDETTAIRTLELLKGLETAAAGGDIESAKILGEQLTEQISNRDQTLSLLEKQNTLTNALIAETTSQTRSISEQTRLLGDVLVSSMDQEMQTVFKGLGNVLRQFEADADQMMTKYKSGEVSIDNISQFFKGGVTKLEAELGKSMDAQQQKSNEIQYGQGTAAADTTNVAALIRAVEQLVSGIQMLVANSSGNSLPGSVGG